MTTTDTPWYKQAACDGRLDLYDAADRALKSNNADRRATAEVEACLHICRSCPVRDACLEDVIDKETGASADRHSIRAGLTPKQRVSLKRRPRAFLPATTENCGTTTGYYQHRRRGETTCQPCRDAIAQEKRDLKNRRETENAA